MLIQVGNLSRAKDVRSEFWSHGLFCRVRYKLGQEGWGYIRLWQTHPWRTLELTLQMAAGFRVSKYVSPPLNDACVDLAVSGLWVVFRYSDPHIQIPKACRIRPDRYWYRWAGKSATRDTSDYSRATVSIESMCCYLCSIMRCAPRRA